MRWALNVVWCAALIGCDGSIVAGGATDPGSIELTRLEPKAAAPRYQCTQAAPRAGVPQNRLLANLAQAMGLTPSDYELDDTAYARKFAARGGKVPGYGDPFIEAGDDKQPYSDAALEQMSDKLPVIT